MARYVALIWDPEDTRTADEASRIEASLSSLSSRWTAPLKDGGVLVMHHTPLRQSNCIFPLPNLQGIVLGSLFRRSPGSRTGINNRCLTSTETDRIIDSGGRHLVEQYWGSYIAVVRHAASGSCSVLRDPTANIACYHAKWNSLHVFFSDAEDFRQAIPLPVSVNWPIIVARLLGGNSLCRHSGLSEVEDVPGGEWITFSRQGEKRTLLWHPGKFCADDSLEDEDRAAQELKQVVVNSVHTLASEHSDIIVRLSGGLDSSIVTSCLSMLRRKPNVTCLNFYIPTDYGDESKGPLPPGLTKENLAKLRRVIGGADERHFARSVAHKCGFRLVEREKTATDWDFRRVWNAPLAPSPSYYVFVLDEDEAESDCAINTGATACFTGEAGDTVFYHTLRAIGALDYAYSHPFGSDLVRYVSDTVTLSGESIARVWGKVLKHGLLRLPLPAAFEPLGRPHLLRDDVARTASGEYFSHPWVSAAPRLCPGKRNHVIGVASSVPFYYHAYNRERVAPSVHPLASQPVVETCLRIPTYVLLLDGTPRGLARRAFAPELPIEVARRTVKGMSIAFWQRLLRSNVQFLRECLLNGLLAQNGVVDRSKLERYLVADQPFLTVQPHQIMEYVACEAWLRQWASA